jgi:3'-phosphoadenosine 5'-phosphosulfate (PAPS) 3'-phosphatase
MSTSELRSLLEIARRAAHRAGVAILEVYNAVDAPDVRRKADDSPVTRADERADAIIVEMLRAEVPGIPVIAEETAEREGLPGAPPPRRFRPAPAHAPRRARDDPPPPARC